MLELTKSIKKFEQRLAVVYGIGFIALSLLSISSNYVLKEQAARQAASFIKRTVKIGDNRETIYTLNDAKLDHFTAVANYDAEDRKLFSVPPQVDPDFLKQPSFLSKLFYSRVMIDLYMEDAQTHKIGSVLFIFGRFSHLPYAIGIWIFFLAGIIPILRSEKKRLIKEQKREILLHEESSRADLARRVRHDIRSPVGALQIAARNLSGLAIEDQAIIRQSIERIREIISELEMVKSEQQPRLPVSHTVTGNQRILSLVQEIIREKRLQVGSRIEIIPQFSAEASLLYTGVETAEFKRTLSNIIDNAVEASAPGSQVIVRLGRKADKILVQVKDHGTGIAKDDLLRVKEKGFTKKSHGSGLGLYYAEKSIQDAGGSLTLESELTKGTTVTIFLTASHTPSLFVERLTVPQNGTVVVVDDQESIHLSLKLRLEEHKAETGARFDILCFYRSRDFLDWYRDNNPANVLFLLDYDLGPHELNGLELFSELRNNESAVLVTGHYDLEEVQRKCEDLGLEILPKSQVSVVRIESA